MAESTQHTPYDAKIEEMKRTDAVVLGLLDKAKGYRQCQADYVPLLEAAKAVLERPARNETICLADISSDPCTCGGHDALSQLRAAIAAVTKGEA